MWACSAVLKKGCIDPNRINHFCFAAGGAFPNDVNSALGWFSTRRSDVCFDGRLLLKTCAVAEITVDQPRQIIEFFSHVFTGLFFDGSCNVYNFLECFRL